MSDWDEMDQKYGRKVRYYPSSARVESTAYLDAQESADVFSGVDKHTDEPVTVRWTGTRYEEV